MAAPGMIWTQFASHRMGAAAALQLSMGHAAPIRSGLGLR